MNRIIGTVDRMVYKDGNEQAYTFVKYEGGKKEAFVHRSNFINEDEWSEMSGLVGARNKVQVLFEIVESPKGPRAGNVEIMR